MTNYVLSGLDLLKRAVEAYEASPKPLAHVQHHDPVDEACRRLERKIRTRLGVDVTVERSAFASPMEVEATVSDIRFALDGDELVACMTCTVCVRPAWFPISSLAKLGALVRQGAVCYRCKGKAVER